MAVSGRDGFAAVGLDGREVRLEGERPSSGPAVELMDGADLALYSADHTSDRVGMTLSRGVTDGEPGERDDFPIKVPSPWPHAIEVGQPPASGGDGPKPGG